MTRNQRPATADEIRLYEQTVEPVAHGESLHVIVSIENGVRVRAFYLQSETTH